MSLRRLIVRSAPVRLMLALSAASLLLSACGGCERRPPDVDAPPHLPSIPAGYGTAWREMPAATVEERRLRLPEDAGEQLALELTGDIRMADLSAPFAELQQRRGEAPVCLAVAAEGKRRCVLMRPMSGEQFGEWLDADRPRAKLRLVMRSDGIEVVGDRGKVPGPDRYGPSIPPVDGRPDFARLEQILDRLAATFPDENQAVLAPSGGMEMSDVARALALLHGRDGARFPTVFLVYP